MLYAQRLLLLSLFGISGCGTTTQRIDPIINEKNEVDVLPLFKSVQQDYIHAFCKSDGPLVYSIPFKEELAAPKPPEVVGFMCVPNEGLYAIDILCIDERCSVGISKTTIREFESGVQEEDKEPTDASDYIESI